MNARLIESLEAGDYLLAIESLEDAGEFRLSVQEAGSAAAANGKRPLRGARKVALRANA